MLKAFPIFFVLYKFFFLILRNTDKVLKIRTDFLSVVCIGVLSQPSLGPPLIPLSGFNSAAPILLLHESSVTRPKLNTDRVSLSGFDGLIQSPI